LVREDLTMSLATESFVVLGPEHAERASLEDFIRTVFEKAYGAKVRHFARVLLGVRGTDGEWAAALGYTPAEGNELFVENYGGGSVEEQVSQKLDTPVMRDQIVEVGNLAARSPGAARQLIAGAIKYLYEAGFCWVIFTGTRALLNSFSRLDLRPIPLATANPARLSDQGRSWGSYYDTQPQIMAGSILLGYVSMGARRKLAATLAAA
jgi:Thermostable hemolysin